MTTKEFLSQAYLFDQRIKSKLEQVQSLRSLAEKASATLMPTPLSKTRHRSQIEDVIIKIVDLENEIGSSITRLLELKQEIATAIECVDNQTYRTLLELRYLCFKRWDEISAELGYERRYVLKVHDRAVQKIDQKRDTKRHKKTLENHSEVC